MRRWFLRWLAPLLLAGTCWLPVAHAQEPSESTDRNPALQYGVAVLATMLVMVILCTPSRKV